MSSQRSVIGGGANLTKDYQILLSFLEKNFQVKSNWRDNNGLLMDSQIHVNDKQYQDNNLI